MAHNPGIICSIDTGGICISFNKEQEPQFAALKKHYVHFMNDDYTPVKGDNGFNKKGLIDSSRLKLIGHVD